MSQYLAPANTAGPRRLLQKNFYPIPICHVLRAERYRTYSLQTLPSKQPAAPVSRDSADYGGSQLGLRRPLVQSGGVSCSRDSRSLSRQSSLSRPGHSEDSTRPGHPSRRQVSSTSRPLSPLSKKPALPLASNTGKNHLLAGKSSDPRQPPQNSSLRRPPGGPRGKQPGLRGQDELVAAKPLPRTPPHERERIMRINAEIQDWNNKLRKSLSDYHSFVIGNDKFSAHVRSVRFADIQHNAKLAWEQHVRSLALEEAVLEQSRARVEYERSRKLQIVARERAWQLFDTTTLQPLLHRQTQIEQTITDYTLEMRRLRSRLLEIAEEQRVFAAHEALIAREDISGMDIPRDPLGPNQKLKSKLTDLYSTSTDIFAMHDHFDPDKANILGRRVGTGSALAHSRRELRDMLFDLTDRSLELVTLAHEFRHFNRVAYMATRTRFGTQAFGYAVWFAPFYVAAFALRTCSIRVKQHYEWCQYHKLINFRSSNRSLERLHDLMRLLRNRASEIQNGVADLLCYGHTTLRPRSKFPMEMQQIANCRPFASYLLGLKDLLHSAEDYVQIIRYYSISFPKAAEHATKLSTCLTLLRHEGRSAGSALEEAAYRNWRANDHFQRKPKDSAMVSGVNEERPIVGPGGWLSPTFSPSAQHTTAESGQWSKDQVNLQLNKKMAIEYCVSRAGEYAVARKFLSSRVLGFDVLTIAPAESNNASPRLNVQAVLLANEERIAIFHYSFYDRTLVWDDRNTVLRRILEDPSILKVGVNMRAHADLLADYTSSQLQGWVDLGTDPYSDSQSSKEATKTPNLSLEQLVASAFGVRLPPLVDKRKILEEGVITEDRLQYLASRPFAALNLFHSLGKSCSGPQRAQTTKLAGKLSLQPGGLEQRAPPQIPETKAPTTTLNLALEAIAVDKDWLEGLNFGNRARLDFSHKYLVRTRRAFLSALSGSMAMKHILQRRPIGFNRKQRMTDLVALKAYLLYTMFGEGLATIDGVLGHSKSANQILYAVRKLAMPLSAPRTRYVEAAAGRQQQLSPAISRAESWVEEVLQHAPISSSGALLRSQAAARRNITGRGDPLIIYAMWYDQKGSFKWIRKELSLTRHDSCKDVDLFSDVEFVMRVASWLPVDRMRLLQATAQYRPERAKAEGKRYEEQQNQANSRHAEITDEMADAVDEPPKVTASHALPAPRSSTKTQGKGKSKTMIVQRRSAPEGPSQPDTQTGKLSIASFQALPSEHKFQTTRMSPARTRSVKARGERMRLGRTEAAVPLYTIGGCLYLSKARAKATARPGSSKAESRTLNMNDLRVANTVSGATKADTGAGPRRATKAGASIPKAGEAKPSEAKAGVQKTDQVSRQSSLESDNFMRRMIWRLGGIPAKRSDASTGRLKVQSTGGTPSVGKQPTPPAKTIEATVTARSNLQSTRNLDLSTERTSSPTPATMSKQNTESAAKMSHLKITEMAARKPRGRKRARSGNPTEVVNGGKASSFYKMLLSRK